MRIENDQEHNLNLNNKLNYNLLVSPYLSDGVVFLLLSFFVPVILNSKSRDKGNISSINVEHDRPAEHEHEITFERANDL